MKDKYNHSQVVDEHESLLRKNRISPRFCPLAIFKKI